jgi:hypothetical protein
VSFGEWSADVDVEIAPLVFELWRGGIETVSACQDEGESLLALAHSAPWLVEQSRVYAGRAYVDLLHTDDACRFLDAVTNAGPRNALYRRMSSLATPDAWEVRLALYDTLSTQETGDWNSPSAFGVGVVRVRFPRGDVEEVVDRLQRWNSGGRGPFGAPED